VGSQGLAEKVERMNISSKSMAQVIMQLAKWLKTTKQVMAAKEAVEEVILKGVYSSSNSVVKVTIPEAHGWDNFLERKVESLAQTQNMQAYSPVSVYLSLLI